MTKIPSIAVQDYGQSIWYDNISRDLIQAGKINELVEKQGVMGITSNPAIFMKAISDGHTYDVTIAEKLNQDAASIYEELAIADIQAAADILRPVYDRTRGVDGYVSLEVSPLLADDRESTLKEARRLFKIVNRPNAMIKIPGTDSGVAAAEDAIAEGINVNYTLIFSLDNYRAVAESYIRGLERRLSEEKDVKKIASVASFFISRIDAAVDKKLAEINQQSMAGKVAIANAQLTYAVFQEIFYGERFKKLREAGAMVQRPLWASTGTKDPSYPDTLYVDKLIAADTVNTVPPATLNAFIEHGKVGKSLEETIANAQPFMDKLAALGIDLDEVTRKLQIDGVKSFVDSFEKIMLAVDKKKRALGG